MLPDDIYTISLSDKKYPALLKQISDPPEKLYVRGDASTLSHKRLLAVVGSRKHNSYGKRCADNLLPEAIEAGLWIVSGLAYGIDTLAHKACLETNTPTIAVLGSGIDDVSIYPKRNLKLALQILKKGGALVSEYPPGSKPLKHHFPTRNRIVAGLCSATLLIQAAKKSGTLITARLALEYNREVLAVPGPIDDDLSAGTNHLIQQGATPALTAQDIVSVYDREQNYPLPFLRTNNM